MEREKTGFTTVDGYIAGFPPDIRQKLLDIRSAIREAVPEAEEKISYQMPTYFLNGNLIHFAAFKKHIGLYPTPDGIDAFAAELSEYTSAKGSVQFPLDKPLPLKLIAKIAKYRAAQNRGKIKSSKESRK